MPCENDSFGNSEKECTLEDTLDSRLVSHPNSALSLDRIPGNSVLIVARPLRLDSVVPDYAVTQPAAADLVRTRAPRRKSITNVNAQTSTRPRPIIRTWRRAAKQTVNGHSPCNFSNRALSGLEGLAQQLPD
jgi:hypothetical protein